MTIVKMCWLFVCALFSKTPKGSAVRGVIAVPATPAEPVLVAVMEDTQEIKPVRLQRVCKYCGKSAVRVNYRRRGRTAFYRCCGAKYNRKNSVLVPCAA